MQKFFKIMLATILTIFTIPFGGITALADGEKVYDDIEDGEYEIKVTSSSTAAAGFLTDKAKLIIDGTELKLIVSYKSEGYDLKWTKLEGKEPVEEVEEDGVKHFTFKIDKIKSKYDKEMEYAVPGLPGLEDGHEVSYDLILDKKVLENLPLIEEKPDSEDQIDNEKPENPKENDKGNSEDTDSENGNESDEDKTPEEDGKEEGSENTEGEESEDEATEVEPLADGAYAFSYTTEGADLGRYYEDKVIVIVDGDKQYLQLQGTGMRQFVEYLYIDGQRMEISVATNEAGAYIAQIELDEKVEKNAPLAFDMVINAMGRIMVHGSEITLDLSSAENIDSAELIEGVPAAENETFVTSKDSVSYEYDSGDVDLSRYYEDTINVLEKDGKQYIEFKGTGMVNFIEALYVDGKKMAIEQNEDGSYVAQVEYEKSVTEKFNFTMIINARGQIMSHSANIEVIIPEEVIEVESGEEKQVSGNQTLVISNGKSDEKVTIVTPPTLPDDTKIKVEIIGEEDQAVQVAKENDYEVAGPVIDVTLDMNGELKYEETLTLTLPYDANKYNKDSYDVDIYKFDGTKWIAQEGNVEGGQISLEVKGFSKYGVFAKKKSETDKTDLVKYSVDYIIKHATKDEKSVADGFFVKPGTLIEQDGKTYLELKVTGWSFIDGLKYNGTAVKIISEDTKENTAVIQLEVTGDLSDVINLNMVITVPGVYEEQEHDARLIIDPETKKEIEADDNGKPGTPSTPGKPGKDNTKDDDKDKKTKTDKVDPDEVYSIDYVVWHKTEDKPSAADGFFVKPGHILVKDGQKYLQLTIKNWEFINSLKYNGKDVLVAKINDDGSALVQLKLDGDLSEIIKLDMNLTVPGVYENQNHSARLVLYPDSLSELDEEEASDFVIYDTSETPEKPSFGENGDNDKKPSGKSTDKNDPKNPKTGDTSKVFLYTMLLLGSLIPLGVQLRRRFVKA